MPAGTAGRRQERRSSSSLVLAAVLGLVTLRTREFVFSLVTYAAAVVAMEVAFNWSFLGGSDGIVGVPPLELTLFGRGITGSGNAELWPIAWALLMLTLLFIQRFRHSRLGTVGADGADESRPRPGAGRRRPARCASSCS